MTDSEPKGSPVRACLEVVSLAVLAFVLALVAAIVALVPLIVFDYGIETRPAEVGLFIAGMLGFLIAGGLYVRYRPVPLRIARLSRTDWRYIGGGLTVALVSYFGLSFVLDWLGLLPSGLVGDMATTDPQWVLIMAGLSVVLTAPAEELLFRGAIQGRLREFFGPVPTIAAAGIIFGVMHAANYQGAVEQIVGGVLLISVGGVILGAVYELTDNLAATIILHALFNVILMSTAYLGAVYL